MKRQYIPIEGQSELVKDISSGAVLNINSDAINKARMRKVREAEKEKELVELKNDISEIKQMLSQLTKKMVEPNKFLSRTMHQISGMNHHMLTTQRILTIM